MLKWTKLKPFFSSFQLALNSKNPHRVPLSSTFRQSPYISSSLPSNLNPHFSHALIVKNGLETDILATSELLLSYYITGHVLFSQSLFTILFGSHIHLLNYKLKELSDNGLLDKILYFYFILRLSDIKPDHFTYPCVLKACAGLNASIEGILIHSQITKSGFDHNVVVTNSLIDMYSKVGSLGSARGIFDEMPKRNLVSWNCMISGYALNGFPCAALGLCCLMKFEGMELDKVTLKIVLPACGLLRTIQVGEQLHAHVIVLGFASDTMIVTAVMDMYAKCGIIDAAEKLFDEILHKDAITWNAMISGYSRKGQLEMVLKFFCKMVAESVEPTAVTMLLSLQACADFPSLQTGETIHGSLVKKGLSSCVSVEALLINTYSKCGRLDLACRAFLTITEESVNSWSAIIHGLGMHGYGEAALMSFIKMLKRGINPDGVCFLVVLSSCSHSGMVSEGYKVFEYMVRQFGLVPKMEHYATMVDLVGRAGFIDEAFQFIGGMPIEPDISIWGAFFGACKIHGKFDIGISTERLVELDPKTAGYYKLLVNTYASKGRWDEVHQVRRLISERRVQRAIGYSLLVVEGFAS